MYPIVTVPPDASEVPEQVGTKFKFWYRGDDGKSLMFKMGREGTGENWSEKVACELAGLLGLPHAEYDLASWQSRLGTVTVNFVPDRGRLVLGNELLSKFHSSYEGEKRFNQRQHTVLRVIAALRVGDLRPPIGTADSVPLTTAPDFFVGYALLDAWIGNTDRHHENWGLVVSATGTIHLAPTFDHASSLGRELSDDVRRERLATRDQQRTVTAYAARASSALYRAENDPKPLSPLAALREVAKLCPSGAAYWSDRLRGVSDAQIEAVMAQVPPEVMSDSAREFAKQLLLENRRQILAA